MLFDLYWEGAADFEFTPLFRELALQGSVFFDVGSNLGFYSFLAHAVNPRMEIHAFEPSNGPHYYLSRNQQHNDEQTAKVSVHKLALSSMTGAIQFFEEINPKYPYLTHHLSGIGNTGNSTSMRKSRTYDVPTETLDGFVQRLNLTSVDLIKMDTEGTEHLILSKGYEMMQKFRPIFIIEVIDDEAGNALEKHILANDYLTFQYTDKGLVALEHIRAGTTEKDRNFFFVHPTKLSKLLPFMAK